MLKALRDEEGQLGIEWAPYLLDVVLGGGLYSHPEKTYPLQCEAGRVMRNYSSNLNVLLLWQVGHEILPL